jgi:hypothetical protein
VDQAQALPCCQFADEETIRGDSQEFDCRTCEITAQLNGLDDDNRFTWALHRQLCNRFVNDLQAGSVLLSRLTEHQEQDEFAETCERLRVIYDTVQPPKET